MRQLFFLLITAITFVGQAQEIQFAHVSFKNYLLKHAQVQGYENGAYPVIQLDADSNGVVSVDEAKRVYRLTCLGNVVGLHSNDKIIDIGGIEFFENLEFLDISEQRIPHVKIDKNKKLKTFVSLSAELGTATFIGLDSLTVIDIDNNRLYSLILRGLPSLKSVSVLSNYIVDIDASECSSIADIQVKHNPIENLCVPTQAYAGVSVDTALTVDTLCGKNIPENNIYFPDSLFKNYLINHASLSRHVGNKSLPFNIDPDGDGEISYEDAKKVHTMHCAGYQVNVDTLTDLFSDMTGIEEFENLFNLQVDNHKIERIDLSKNKKLQLVALNRNKLKEIRAVGLDSLEVLSVLSNDITSVELSDLNSIVHVELSDNKLTNVDLSGIKSLNNIRCEKNNLSSICVSGVNYESLTVTSDPNTKVDTLCGRNEIYITDKNLLNAILSYTPKIDTNGDSIISYGEALAVDSLDLSFKNITLLTGLEAFKNLKSINVSWNKLTFLDLAQLKYLQQIVATNNQISGLITFSGTTPELRTTQDDKVNTTISKIDLSNNVLTNLDVSDVVNLENLNVTGNSELSSVCVNSEQLQKDVNDWEKDSNAIWSNSGCKRTVFVNAISVESEKIYPNPTKDVVFYTGKLNRITSSYGEVVMGNNYSSSVSLTHLSNGVYFLHFENGSVQKILLRK